MALVYRLAVPDDCGQLYDIYSPYITDSVATFEITVPTLEQYRLRIANISSFHPYIVCEEEGTLLGYAYATRFQEREGYDYDVGVSIYLRQGGLRKGIGTELYKRLFALLPAQNFQMAYAIITQPNHASNAIHERFGFTPVGLFKNSGYKQGKWLDVLWMEKRLGNFPTPPEPLKSIGQLDIDFVDAVLAAGHAPECR